MKAGIRATGIEKPASCHTLRHSCAVRLLLEGHDVSSVQELLGHRDVSTTSVYTRLLPGNGPA